MRRIVTEMCFKPSQITKGYFRAEGDFYKMYTAERANMAEIRPDEQSEKAELSREFME